MTTSSSSEVVYEGEVIITEFDTERLEELDAVLRDFVELEEGEDLYVSLPGGDRLEVRKLRERT